MSERASGTEMERVTPSWGSSCHWSLQGNQMEQPSSSSAVKIQGRAGGVLLEAHAAETAFGDGVAVVLDGDFVGVAFVEGGGEVDEEGAGIADVGEGFRVFGDGVDREGFGKVELDAGKVFKSAEADVVGAGDGFLGGVYAEGEVVGEEVVVGAPRAVGSAEDVGAGGGCGGAGAGVFWVACRGGIGGGRGAGVLGGPRRWLKGGESRLGERGAWWKCTGWRRGREAMRFDLLGAAARGFLVRVLAEGIAWALRLAGFLQGGWSIVVSFSRVLPRRAGMRVRHEGEVWTVANFLLWFRAPPR